MCVGGGGNLVPRSFPLEIGRGKALGTGLGEGGREQHISVETSWDCSAKF